MNKKVPDITESVKELKSLMSTAKDTTEKDKIRMLYLLKSGEAKNRIGVAALLGMCRETIGQWLSKYEARGLEQLLERRYAPGRKPFMTPDQLETLREKLNEPEGFSSYVEIHRYVIETFGVEISYQAIYALVHDRWHAKLKVPRKSHIKKTPMQQMSS